MARLDARHWLISSGETWAAIALAVGVSRNTLLTANGLPTTGTPAPVIGQVVHLPLAGP